uniref:Uncharacterized protein n=1 Tax=viral metagenome TaxID=1070528 RepID=A0A6C0ED89_9ZZZZ
MFITNNKFKINNKVLIFIYIIKIYKFILTI